MIVRILRKLSRKKPFNPVTQVAEPTSNVGEPVGGRNWYRAKSSRLKLVGKPVNGSGNVRP
jgi:hypothetical protein